MNVDASNRVRGGERLMTPSGNPDLPQRLADFSSLAEGLDYAARGVTGYNFYSSKGSLQHVLTYAQLRDDASAAGRRLISLGLARLSRVAVIAETGPEFMAIFFGCQYAGLVACPLPYSMYIGGRAAYVDRIAGMLRAAHARAVITTPDLIDHVSEAASRAGTGIVKTHQQIAELPAEHVILEALGPDEPAYIQYSSGSTSDPKGVLISQRAIVANTRGILFDGLKIRSDDRAFSWLPLYHDMGLVGFCLAPMMGQVSVDYLATPSFARRPALWLKLMSENRSTVAYAPSFGYDLAARRINGEAATLDLSAWRAAGIGGDMVRVDVLTQFAEIMKVAKFNPNAFLPSYGMAESTLAITIAEAGAPIKVDTVDKNELKYAGRAVPAKDDHSDDVRRFVACGRPLPGCTVEIRDDHGNVLGHREIGRLFVKSPSLMAGYFRNESATRSAIGDDGFMDTGDMAYWLDDEIVITGRAKDLILHNGRNIWPQDIEWAVERVEPLRHGDVAAFAVEGDDDEDDVVVLVQCRLKDKNEMERLRRNVAAVVHQTVGIECDVILVPPKSLPFTSSGKLSRAGAKQQYLSGEILELESDRPPKLRTLLEAAQ
jgi:fatty-acyl-CoA synthase